MSLINENIKQMKLLINYNPKLTLTENVNVLSEGQLSNTLKIMSPEVTTAFKTELSSLESVKKIIGNNKSFKNVDELFDSLRAGRYSGDKILKDILKNPKSFATKFPEVYKSATSNYAHQLMNSKTELAIKFQKATPEGRKEMLKQFGYNDQAIKDISNEVMSIKNTKINAKVDAKSKVGVSKGLDESGKKIKQEIIDNQTKPKSWWKSRLQKWGWIDDAGKITKKGKIRGGIIAGTAFIAWMVSGDEKSTPPYPNPNPMPNPKPMPVVDPKPRTKPVYTNCTDFPYKKNCSSPIVAEVQKCLGLTDDGKFGSKTEEALIKAGYSAEITKEVYDKIKEKCGSNTVTEPIVNPDKIDPNSVTYTDVSFDDL